MPVLFDFFQPAAEAAMGQTPGTNRRDMLRRDANTVGIGAMGAMSPLGPLAQAVAMQAGPPLPAAQPVRIQPMMPRADEPIGPRTAPAAQPAMSQEMLDALNVHAMGGPLDVTGLSPADSLRVRATAQREAAARTSPLPAAGPPMPGAASPIPGGQANPMQSGNSQAILDRMMSIINTPAPGSYDAYARSMTAPAGMPATALPERPIGYYEQWQANDRARQLRELGQLFSNQLQNNLGMGNLGLQTAEQLGFGNIPGRLQNDAARLQYGLGQGRVDQQMAAWLGANPRATGPEIAQQRQAFERGLGVGPMPQPPVINGPSNPPLPQVAPVGGSGPGPQANMTIADYWNTAIRQRGTPRAGAGATAQFDVNPQVISEFLNQTSGAGVLRDQLADVMEHLRAQVGDAGIQDFTNQRRFLNIGTQTDQERALRALGSALNSNLATPENSRNTWVNERGDGNPFYRGPVIHPLPQDFIMRLREAQRERTQR